MLFRKKDVVGLDIGTSAIKLAELDVSRKGATLKNFGMAPVPPSGIGGGEIIDPGLIADVARQLVDEIQPKKKAAAAGLWGSAVIVKRISVPQMDESLVAEQIRWEAEQYIPFDINQVNLEYKILTNNSGDSSETMDILLVAAVQEHILRLMEVVEGAGLSCEILDVSGFALANCFEKNYGSVSGENIALINIGASITNYVVVENGEVIFCRDIPVGGHNYTSEVQKGLGMSFEEAEGLKLSFGSGSTPDELADIIQGTHEMVCDEINGSTEFFLNTNKTEQLTSMYITGGGCRVPGLIEALSRNYTVEKLDPFAQIEVGKSFTPDYLDQIRDFAAVAIGLGLRTIGDS